MTTEGIRLTQYSHGAGCGCKIAPDVLSRILAEADGGAPANAFPSLLVGHQSRDDAAAVILDEDRAVLSTTDFFMPIVDDPYDLVASPPPMRYRTSTRWVAPLNWLSLS